MSRARWARSRWAVAAILLGLLAACGSVDRRPLPDELVAKARLIGEALGPDQPKLRCYEVDFERAFGPSLATSFVDERPEDYALDEEGRRIYPILCLSSGGSDGAFGAGLLNGWSEKGTRPRFKVVTGVSTGALIAPFAFLGSDHDALLRQLYTEVGRDDVAAAKNPLAVFYSDSLASNEPLLRLIERHVDAEFLRLIAEEHDHGRRLYVATTNLDRQRLVVWDLGAIARRGDEAALHLFQEVLLASAAIPVVFPPVYIRVEADGESYDEMHVDGSVRSLFFLPRALTRRLGHENGVTRLYLIRNGQLSWTFAPVEPSVVAIAGRTILTLLQSMAREELEGLYLLSRAGEVDFNLTSIPSDYERGNEEEFDREEMRRLYAIGLALGRSDRTWTKAPPGLDSEP
ncbi:MAG: patatin-like phospholipase family protein [Planctomycetes bacterium]|nr:patatin-like phospholipase family protein [Planctomycetota bacterium]